MAAKFKVADLFSGAGGASYGFAAHPAFKVIFAVDKQQGKPSSGAGKLECNSTYERNIGIKPVDADLAAYEPRKLARDLGLKKGELDILISCAPCTGFSRTLRKNHLEDDPRNHLVARTGLFVEAIRPKILVMENAREMLRGNFSYHSEELKEHLDRLGYSMLGEIHMLTKFGLPQIRERALIVACRDGATPRSMDELWEGFSVDPQCTTVRHAISHLPKIKAGEMHPDDPMHVSPSLGKETTRKRMAAMPLDGGQWRDLINHPNADELLIPSMKRSVEQGNFGSHPDVYGRLWWDRPAATIKRECGHIGNGRYSHPEQHRLCTVREMGLLQGFPSSYTFVANSLTNMYRHIGDAVPPLISYQLAGLCNWMLTDRKPELSECILPETSLATSAIVPIEEPETLYA